MTILPVSLIGVPTDVGAGTPGRPHGAGGAARCRHRQGDRPVWCRGQGLRQLGGPANPDLPAVNGFRHMREVVAWNRSVHAAVHAELKDGRLPIMLGGDHCLAIGSISAVARHCRETGRHLRVLWFDAHADFNTATMTPSGNIHGMPALACAVMAHRN
jgi:arginase